MGNPSVNLEMETTASSPRKKVTLLCAQPSIQYFAWQAEVMLTNFRDFGIHLRHNIELVWAYNKNESDWLEKLSIVKKVEQKFKAVARFFYYEDTREYPISYISSIRPNVLKQHFEVFPELSEGAVFYHDCDIVFTKYPIFLEDDNIIQNDENYVSDTLSYLNYDYIISKGENVLNAMCEIVGITPELVKEKNDQAGGAQYILKNVDYTYWHNVEKKCERLYKEITQLNQQLEKEDPKYHALQIWTSDMWLCVWELWLMGKNTIIIPEMDFTWATDSIDKWGQTYIFHNAGVTGEMSQTHFFKGAYIQNLPFKVSGTSYEQRAASYRYFEIVKSIGDDSCLN